jgi:hypothetical protein
MIKKFYKFFGVIMLFFAGLTAPTGVGNYERSKHFIIRHKDATLGKSIFEIWKLT